MSLCPVLCPLSYWMSTPLCDQWSEQHPGCIHHTPSCLDCPGCGAITREPAVDWLQTPWHGWADPDELRDKTMSISLSTGPSVPLLSHICQGSVLILLARLQSADHCLPEVLWSSATLSRKSRQASQIVRLTQNSDYFRFSQLKMEQIMVHSLLRTEPVERLYRFPTRDLLSRV